MAAREIRKRVNGLQTSSLILKFACEELARSGSANFSVDRVQQEAGVSRSSLYHHFGNRDGLITAANIQTIHEELNAGISDLRRQAESLDSGQQIVDLIKAAVRETSSAFRRDTRQVRAGTFAAGRHSETVSRALREAESRNLEDFTDFLEYARGRNLLRPQEPMVGTITVISSLMMGRIVIDVLKDPQVEDAWVEVACDIVQRLLQPVN